MARTSKSARLFTIALIAVTFSSLIARADDKVVNAQNHVIRSTDASGRVTSYTYSRDGKLMSMKSADGKGTAYLYDENGKWIETRGPIGTVVPASGAAPQP